MNVFLIWEALHDLFDLDDGSLPEIDLTGLTGKHVADIFLFLSSQSQDITIGGARFWDKTLEQTRSVADIDSAANLVVHYKADSFYMVIGNLNSKDIIIPSIGIFVFQESISLDYRKGHNWSPEKIAALLEILCDLNKIAPEMQVTFQEGTTEVANERFQTK
jgi:hypothetical protein